MRRSVFAKFFANFDRKAPKIELLPKLLPNLKIKESLIL